MISLLFGIICWLGASISLFKLFVSDWQRGTLPDLWVLRLLLFFAGLTLFRIVDAFPETSLITLGIMLPFCFLEKMGWGDLKLLGVLTFLLSLNQLWIFLVISGALGLFVFILFFRNQRAFPLGPSLIVSFLITITLYPTL